MTAPAPRYLLRIQLKDIRPPLWREVIVPANISLAWLHEVIQAAMFWDDMHLHQFEQKGRFYGLPSSEDFSEMYNERKVALCDLVKKPKDWIRYEYDFGDSWEHRVELKKILEPDAEDFLRCVKGKGGDIIEDCGGAHGYMELMKLKQAVEFGSKKVDREDYDYYELADHDFGNCDLSFANENLGEVQIDAEEGGGLHPRAAPPIANPMFGDFHEDDEEDDFDDYFNFGLESEASPPEELAEESFPEPYSELKPDALAEFGETMRLAQKVRTAQPWKELYDSDIFAVEDPTTKELDIVSVLGGGKEVYAIHVHRPPSGLAFWKMALTGSDAMIPEVIMKMSNMVEVEFLNKAEMEEPDLALYEYTGVATPGKGRHGWVRFRSYRPRCFPWFSEAADLATLRRGMALALRYLELMQDSEEPVSFMRPDEGPALPESLKVFRLPTGAKAGDSGAWRLEDISVDWDQCGQSEVVFQPGEFELSRLAAIPQKEDVWELGATCLTSGVMTETGPVMPVLAMAASLSGGEVPPTPEFTDDLAVSETEAMWNSLANNMDATGYRPTEIRVTSTEAVKLLEPFAQLAGIRVERVEELEMLDSLFQMLAMMPGPRDM